MAQAGGACLEVSVVSGIVVMIHRYDDSSLSVASRWLSVRGNCRWRFAGGESIIYSRTKVWTHSWGRDRGHKLDRNVPLGAESSIWVDYRHEKSDWVDSSNSNLSWDVVYFRFGLQIAASRETEGRCLPRGYIYIAVIPFYIFSYEYPRGTQFPFYSNLEIIRHTK